MARRALPVPFGLNENKPTHYRTMLRVLWDNRDNLEYAWRVLNRGTCDGCALGTTGMKDWTLDGTHVCVVRLELLRLNTMGALDHRLLGDVAALRARSDAELRDLGRLPYPMRRDRGDRGFRRVSWDEALDLAGGRIRAVDPDRVCLFLTSRGVTNEVYYVAQKVARFLGTPHVENSARLCHAPSTVGMKSTVGVGASTVSYTDWIGTDLLVFLGTNFANDQPVATKYVDLARKAGTRVIAVNSYEEPGLARYWVPSTPMSALFGTALVDTFVKVHQGGDLALLLAVMKLLVAQGGAAVDREFVDAHTTGYAELAAHLEKLSLDDLVRLSGTSRPQIEELAATLASARRGVLIWSMGITQHSHGAATVQAICDLALLRGWLGKEKAGLVPIRGHSGVQGGAEMGCYSTALPGGLPVNQENAARFSEMWGFPVPDRPGRTTPDMVAASGRGEVDVLYAVGGNFVATLPRPDLVIEALGRVPLRIHQDIVVNQQMLVDPAETVLLLPARTRYEQHGGGTETTTERRVVFSPYVPGHDVGEARSEWEIIQEVACRAWPERAAQVRFRDAQAIRDEIARAVPSYEGIQRLRRAGDAFQWGGPRLCEGGQFPLPGGKARLVVVSPPELEVPPGKFRLATRRGKQFNSIVWAETDPLNAAKRKDVLMAEEDAKALKLADGDAIVLENDHGTFAGFVKLAPIRPGNIQGHWPEVNVLIPPDRFEPHSKVPDYNALVSIRPAGAIAAAEDTG
jgi:molybdopterin-dependent oxidoreductase alpha subunit